jgi:hypothetical protein
VRSRRRRCAALNSGAVHLTGVRRAPLLPSPRAPIKGSPRALPCPAPASATPLSPRPSSIRGSAAVFSLSGKPFPLFSLLLWLCSKQLARPISFATPPRVWNTAPLPQSPPEAHRRRLPPWSSATSPRTAPSRPLLAKLSPPLGSPAPPRAKAPTHCPRTGSPATNRRRAHRRPGSPRGRPVHPAVDRWRRSPPPFRSLCRVGPVETSSPSRARAVFHLGPAHSRRARAAPDWARIPPSPPELNPFFFFLFFSLFSFN